MKNQSSERNAQHFPGAVTAYTYTERAYISCIIQMTLLKKSRARNDIVDVISGYVKLQRRGQLLFWALPVSQREITLVFRQSIQADVLLLRLWCGRKCIYIFRWNVENYTFPGGTESAGRPGRCFPAGGRISGGSKKAERFEKAQCWK